MLGIAVVLGVVSLGLLIWVVSETDTGMMCEAPYTDADEPAACAIYGVPWGGLLAAVALFFIGVVALIITSAKARRTARR